MPILKFLADTDTLSAGTRGEATALAWLAQHVDQIGISTITLAEIRQGIELKRDTKAGRALEREYIRPDQTYAGTVS
jgi:predicted nucleic acid-binding protein